MVTMHPHSFVKSEQSRKFRNVYEYVQQFDKYFMAKPYFAYNDLDIDTILDEHAFLFASEKIGYFFTLSWASVFSVLKISLRYVNRSGCWQFHGNFPGVVTFLYSWNNGEFVQSNVKMKFHSTSFKNQPELIRWLNTNGMDIENLSEEDLLMLDVLFS